jgi:hypothetical protein
MAECLRQRLCRHHTKVKTAASEHSKGQAHFCPFELHAGLLATDLECAGSCWVRLCWPVRPEAAEGITARHVWLLRAHIVTDGLPCILWPPMDQARLGPRVLQLCHAPI